MQGGGGVPAARAPAAHEVREAHAAPAVIAVRVRGIVRGREIDADAGLSLDGDALRLAWTQAAPWRLALDGLEGLTDGPGQLSLYLASGDVLECTGHDDLRLFARRIEAACCRVPELTRGLRTLGAVRGEAAPAPSGPDAAPTPLADARDRWFAPLLAARRRLEGISDPLRQVELADAGALAAALRDVILAVARDNAPGDAPAQRALAATLEDEAEGTFVALDRLALAADALSGGAADTRLADWRRWCDALHEVFREADEGAGRWG
jgi:hypothetical protein